jgi:hypothetical protein
MPWSLPPSRPPSSLLDKLKLGASGPFGQATQNGQRASRERLPGERTMRTDATGPTATEKTGRMVSWPGPAPVLRSTLDALEGSCSSND